jgi:hypothetical protein
MTRNTTGDRLVPQKSTMAENLQRKKRPALLKEMLSARLLPCHSSRHRSWTTRKRSTRKHQIRPGGSGHHLLHATEAFYTQHLHLRPTLLLRAPRLSLLQTASPPERASVRPRERETTLKGKAVRRVRERGRMGGPEVLLM